ncbi:hypothetical protein [Campylobacter sp. RM16192]|uniref:hypothetical protein n=1 Tax=Campylobacter sp. RM16192 TaxID=1660080 RepID=UPI0014529222|nr:hypothetical protein [Campylobacter sp. RM16192]QCD52862.1 hypothetical protein CDOMC_1255 [Campylobacter sp. RM16192]
MREEDLSIEELSYELSVMLEGMLYYAGVKKDKLQDAAETYIDSIEEALDGSDAEGVDEVIEVIEYMKKKHSKFFK